MNIWYFHHYAVPYSIAGLHRPFEFGEYFNKNGDKITVFISSYLHYACENMISDKSKSRKEIYDGIDTVFIKTCAYGTSGMKRVLNMTQFFFGLFKVTKKYLRENPKPDVIIASSPHPLTMIAGIKIAKKLKIPCICEVRDFWPEVFFMGGRLKENGIIGKILLKGEKWIYEKCDTLVFLKEGDHTYITEHKWDKANGGKIDMKKCRYINNGVDISLFNKRINENTLADEDLDSGKFTAVYCGSVRPVNDVDRLIDAAKLLDPDITMLIYGAGTCLESLKSRIKEEKIENVKIKGYVDNKYVPYILSKSSVNLLHYSAEKYNWSRGNSSNKLFEYLVSGKPVISTVKMGYDIILRYKCGTTVESETAEGIADAIHKIKRLNQTDYETMCSNAVNAAKDFDIPKLARDYLYVINSTVDDYKNKD